jgi:hypothetical protein
MLSAINFTLVRVENVPVVPPADPDHGERTSREQTRAIAAEEGAGLRGTFCEFARW